eukprot:GHRQ01011757.1.p1 GENE.GHRQ01011757.1~~GHRQ01011757.1.p1  ORF type:complete len:144 (+),score=13.80 GHRQ01011757.1:234-665(+)
MCDSSEQASARRLRVLEGHLATISQPKTPISRNNTAGGGSSYATATGEPSSYARVHGEVSKEPAVWRCVETVHRERLEEVVYEKSDEGIAKVTRKPARATLLQRHAAGAVDAAVSQAVLTASAWHCRSPSTGQKSATRSHHGQ